MKKRVYLQPAMRVRPLKPNPLLLSASTGLHTNESYSPEDRSWYDDEECPDTW